MKKEEKYYGEIVCLENPPVGVRRITITVFADKEYWNTLHLGAGIYFTLKG